MNTEGYNIDVYDNLFYTFVSIGTNGTVLKGVDFQEIEFGIYNLALLDYQESNESWSDISVTNNGDIIKTMRTVLSIIINFLENNSQYSVVIRANTQIKLLLYNRIFKNYYGNLSDQITILTDGEYGKIVASVDIIHEVFYIYKNNNA